MRLALLFITSFAFISNAFSQCNSKQPKILMVGDSWSFLAYSFNAMDDVLDQYGFSDYEDFSSGTLSVNGKKTKYLLDTVVLAEIEDAFTNNPSIEFINVSIGGNDLLRGWNKSLTPAQRDSVIDATIERKDSLIGLLKAMKPDIKIYFPQYDFPNFGEAIEAFAPFQDQHPFYDSWDDMGKPTFLEINTALLAYDAKMLTFVAQHANVDYFSASGLMQNLYGQNSPLTVAPGGTYAAGTAPVPGGFPSYPSPLNAMNDYGAFYDAFHISDNSFSLFYDFHFQKYYWDKLRKRDFAGIGSSNDGSVKAASINTTEVAFGKDTSGNESKAILEFNTSAIPSGKVLESGAIFIKRSNLVGSKPISGRVLLEIKSGSFGTSSSLELADFNDVSDKADTACVYGGVSNNKSWLRIDIPDSLLAFVDISGTTQFRISSINGATGELFFATGTDPNHQPQLDIKYKEFASISTNSIESFNVFPNPTNGNLTIQSKDILNGTVTIIDLTGRNYSFKIANNSIKTGNLANGRYMISQINDKRTYIPFIKIN